MLGFRNEKIPKIRKKKLQKKKKKQIYIYTRNKKLM